MNNKNTALKECVYYVEGMHCASCEVLIEKETVKLKGVKAAEASVSDKRLIIRYLKYKPKLSYLNKLFKKHGYSLSEREIVKNSSQPLIQLKNGKLLFDRRKLRSSAIIVGISFAVIVTFLFLNKTGLASLVSVNSESALPAFFAFGLLAGFSTCSALVGGIILSMSKQWLVLYDKNDSTWKKLQPNILFNGGRIFSYVILGAILGMIGGVFQLSPLFTSFLTMAVSVIMVLLAFQMLGISTFQRFQFKAPKFISSYVANEKNFRGRWMPVAMGALTFFLPCGFTITSQSLALLSGNWFQASLIMFSFALGTLPALFLIGYSSVKFSEKPHFASQFTKIAGVLVLFFAIYNANAQLNVLGIPSLSDIGKVRFSSSESEGFPPIVKGKQLVKMDALAYAYEPDYIKVKVNTPVRLEITDRGTSGCTNAIISRELFDGQIDLTPGQVSVKEFNPKTPGKYKFSCWMGMVSGVIEVVDPNSESVVQDASVNVNEVIIDSGAQGCGGSTESSCTGSCGGSCGNPSCTYVRK